MSVTIVAMVNNTHQTASWNNANSDMNDTCHADTNQTDTKIDVTTLFILFNFIF